MNIIPGGCFEPDTVAHATKSGAEAPYAEKDQVIFTCDECYYGGGLIKCKGDGYWTDYPSCYGKKDSFLNVLGPSAVL